MRYVFVPLALLFTAACSAMDQAGMFAVHGVQTGMMDPASAGHYLLVTAFATDHAQAVAMEFAGQAAEILPGISTLEASGIAAGITGVGFAALRAWRGSPFKSGSGGSKPTTPVTPA